MKKILLLLVMASFMPLDIIYSFDADCFNAGNIKKYTSGELLEFLSLPYLGKDCNRGEQEEFYYKMKESVGAELINRKEIELMLGVFDTTKDEHKKEEILNILYSVDDKRIEMTFKKYMQTETTLINYYCINYLAKKGNLKALKILNDNFYNYPVSSWQWSYTVKLFGDYKYKPAICNLVKSLEAASLNVVDACVYSLNKILGLKNGISYKAEGGLLNYYTEKTKKYECKN